MKKAGAYLVLLLLVGVLMALTLPAGAGDYGTTTTTHRDPCDEYHESRHPECQTTTTTTYATTTSSTTTTPNETTTTVAETTTTVVQTTTTIVQCVPPLVHQPPLCVDPTTTTVPILDTTTTVQVTVPEELPFTGASSSALALTASVMMALGLLAMGLSRREA